MRSCTKIFSPMFRPTCGSAANGANHPTAQRFDVIDPATEKTIASVASASVEDAKAAVDAADAAFEGWAGASRASAPRSAQGLLS